MLKRLNGYTKAQLAAGAGDESLDFPAGVVGVPTDSTTELFFFLGDGGRLIGGGEGSGVTTFTQLTDTPASLGTAGQKAVVNSGGTALEFTDALQFNLSGSGYSSGRVLQANGSEYVDILSPALPEPSSTGVMFAWDDTTDTVVQVAAGTQGQVLGVAATGLPEFQTVEAAAGDFFLTQAVDGNPTRTEVQAGVQRGIDWDYKSYCDNGGDSATFITFVLNSTSATTYEYPITSGSATNNRAYLMEVFRGGEVRLSSGTGFDEGFFYFVRATVAQSGSAQPTVYVRSSNNNVWSSWIALH